MLCAGDGCCTVGAAQGYTPLQGNGNKWCKCERAKVTLCTKVAACVQVLHGSWLLAAFQEDACGLIGPADVACSVVCSCASVGKLARGTAKIVAIDCRTKRRKL